jgi:C4-dicarboxylate-specific signal transduction histidine kinase
VLRVDCTHRRTTPEVAARSAGIPLARPMTSIHLQRRRILVRLALLFAAIQLAIVVGISMSVPGLRWIAPGPGPIIAMMVLDLVLLSVFAGWIMWGSVSAPLMRLSEDVQRIADGDYHHRIGETSRVELREIRDSVNRLADRLIADQTLLAENVQSLEESNRELYDARDQVVRSARLASVGTLAAGIAHEVGNPLGAVMAYVDVAAARAHKVGADTEILDSIRVEAKRIDRIVRGLLDYARPPESAPEPMRAQHVIDRIRTLLESQGTLDRVKCVWNIDASEPHIVLEPHRLEQVLVNLLLNAVQAVEREDDPKVIVRLHKEAVELTTLPARREDDPPGINYMHRRRMLREDGAGAVVSTAREVTVIEVIDNGPGIAPEHVEHLFDPFFTTKEPGKGTGLGLSICARLVEEMGGRIDVRNNPDGGACFVIRLPSVDEAIVTAGTTENVETK